MPGAMKIFLTGFMGAGKTTVGRHLADRLQLPFFDLDEEIERQAGRSVRAIFETQGEAEFRRLEHESLQAVCAHPRLVVATGGGTLTLEGNRELIGRSGLSVWLHPPFATLVERIGRGNRGDRPLFQDETQAWTLYRERLPTYQGCDLRIDVEASERAAEVAARIALLIREQAACDI